MKWKNKKLIEQYICFKENCIRMQIVDSDEIIKLFEVWLKQVAL